jgi:ElaB/YqjD/DUF883 family membrane-anchored ribosome-binding protein
MAETKRMEQTLPPDVPRLEPERELPGTTTRTNPRLNEAAEAIGGALGSATRQVHNARERFQVIRGGAEGGPSSTEQLKETAQHKVQEIRQRAESALEQARMQATAKLEDAREKASRLAQRARESATESARMVRLRAARLTNERPLAVLAAIGGAAFLLGIFLRVGRGRRG